MGLEAREPLPEEQDLARRGGIQPGEGVKESCLPGAVRSDDPEGFSLAQGDVDAVEGHEAAEPDRQSLDLEQAHRISALTGSAVFPRARVRGA